MNKEIRVYELLSEDALSLDWPKSSIYRFRSIKARVLKKCKGEIVTKKDLDKFLTKIIKDSLKTKEKLLKERTLNTYKSVLRRFIIEKLVGSSLKPWEANNYLKNI